MDTITASNPGWSNRASQALISLLILLVMVGTFGLIIFASRWKWLENEVIAADLGRFQDNRELLMNRGLFLEFEDRLILDEMPRTDYARGGVFFFGTSSLKWSLKTWALPEELRPLIHNYGIGATSHQLQAQFIRFLAEHTGFLKRKDRTHVVLGLYWSMGLDWSPRGYFGPLWERYKLYRYDSQRGIEPVVMPAILHFWRYERARCVGFLGSSINRLARVICLHLGIPLSETENLRDPRRIHQWAARLADKKNWQESLAHQTRELDALIQYLKNQGIGVTIVLLPQRQAFEEFPFPTAYRHETEQVARQEGIPFIDLSRILSEDEFWDMNHCNYRGLEKVNAVLIEIAVDRLHEMGLVSTK